jgi:hypothetical protein
MSSDNTSKPADQPTSVSTHAEQVKEPVGSKAWETPPQGQDASPTPGQEMPDTPATSVGAQLAEGAGTLAKELEYPVNETPFGTGFPPGTGLAITTWIIGQDLWEKRDVIKANAKEALDKALDKGKAAAGDARDGLLDKGRAVGRATAEAMGEMVHQVHDPP